ncbi:MAG: hypothetical protein ABF248_08485 [Yoonia sp.]
MMVRHLWDGFLSLLAAAATIMICGIPVWFTYQSISAGTAPTWAWIGVVGLGFVGILMTFSFLRKAADGVSPSRERRRR